MTRQKVAKEADLAAAELTVSRAIQCTAMRLTEYETRLFRLKHPTRNGAKSLRLGLVHDRNPAWPWVLPLVGLLQQTSEIEIQVLNTLNHGSAKLKRPAWLVDRLYSMSRPRFDPFGSLLVDRSDSVAPESIDAIRAGNFDVIIWLARSLDPDIDLRGLAKNGVLTVRLGDRNRTIPFWDEVANCNATSTAIIFWHDYSFSQGRAVRKLETSTSQGLFITANAESPLVGTIRMLADVCLEVQQGGEAFSRKVYSVEPRLLDSAVQSVSNIDAARFITKKLARSAYLRLTAGGKNAQWFVALRRHSGDSIVDPTRLNLTGFEEVPLPTGVAAMADPFLWEADGKQFLLFEETAVGTPRGRLGCIEVLADGAYSEMKIILERDYHLSYPCIVPFGGDLFLLPETCEAKRIDLYRFGRFPDELELISTLEEGVPLVDTTPVLVEGRWYLFTTTGEPFMETLLLSATRLDGPWTLHPCNPVSTSVKSCRSAGHLFWEKGRLFRPTQDCSVRYGYAIAVNEVTKLTATEFEERPVSYLPPSWQPSLLGTHTWNANSAFQVIDGIRYAQ